MPTFKVDIKVRYEYGTVITEEELEKLVEVAIDNGLFGYDEKVEEYTMYVEETKSEFEEEE